MKNLIDSAVYNVGDFNNIEKNDPKLHKFIQEQAYFIWTRRGGDAESNYFQAINNYRYGFIFNPRNVIPKPELVIKRKLKR